MNSSTHIQRNADFPSECYLYTDFGGKPTKYSPLAHNVMVFTIIINATTLPFIIMLNLPVIVAVATRTRLQRMYMTIACLAAADLMVGIVVQPLQISLTIKTLKGETTAEACSVQLVAKLFNNFVLFSSLAHLVLMSADRYFAIKHPFRYDLIVTTPRMLVASAIVWILCLILHIFILIKPSIFWSLNKPLVIAFIVIIVLCHAIVYKETRRHEQLIAAQQDGLEARQHYLRQTKSLKLTATICFVFISCCLPAASFRIARNALKSKLSLDEMYTALFATSCLVIVNSLINPLIYCVKLRQFRVAFIEFVFRKNFSEAKEFEKRLFGSPGVVVSFERHENHEDNEGGEIERSNMNITREGREEQHENNQGGGGRGAT